MSALKGYALVDALRVRAEDTANPETAALLLAAADEVRDLVEEVKSLEGRLRRLGE